MPFIDFHVHLRGGMTVEKAVARQEETGIRIGVLRNIGAGWPIETDDHLQAFLKEVEDKPIDMSRCYEAIAKYGLAKGDLYVPLARAK